MKRFYSLILLLLIPTILFASFTDSLSFLKDNETYSRLIESIWNRVELSECKDLHENLNKSLEGQEDWKSLSTRIRSNTALARYCLEYTKKDSSTAKMLLSQAESFLDGLSSSDKGLQAIISVLESDILSVEYLVSPLFNVGKGLESTKIIDRTYKVYPQEVSVSLMYANRRLYAPAIGGKDVDEALSIFSTLASVPRLADWDKFSIFSGLGMCYKEKEYYDDAIWYLQQAMEIYHADEAVIKALKELEEKKN